MIELTLEEKIEKRKVILKQLRQIDISQKMSCECGKHVSIVHMYRCFYCGQFYCPQCAKEHFK